MNITKSIILSALFALVFGTVSANTDPNLKSSRTEIKEMIQKSTLLSNINIDKTIYINFLLNNKNEIIILSTNDPKMDKAIKSVLNYKKLVSKDMQINKTYTLPLVLKK
ncbi:MAG: hypothetical protein V3V14_07400 [Saprospiraceae bacterium]